jgi:DNA-directed RNA polymerase subunit RPC12/RpoP
MADSFKEFEASSLFCVRCKRATPTRKKLLLVLPTGNKYDYTCSVCGTQVGGKTDSDATDFYRSAPGPAVPPGRGGRPPRPQLR